MAPSYTEAELREAVLRSRSLTETLRNLDLCCRGGAPRVLKKYLALWHVDTAHFDATAALRESVARRRRPLEEVLVDEIELNSASLKERLYREGRKEPVCELCGQDEEWRGRRMSLILDHINGRRLDNRLANLRIVCPNCNATLATHCGRNAQIVSRERDCELCGEPFRPKHGRQRYCSRTCGQRWKRDRAPRPATRRVQRPLFAQLLDEIDELGWSGTGRKYGVSDNAIRKWVARYQREEREEGEARAARGIDPADVGRPGAA